MKNIYDYEMNEQEANRIISKLREERCIRPDNGLGIWPEWLSWKMVQQLVYAGYMRREYHMYAQDDFYLTGISMAMEKEGMKATK